MLNGQYIATNPDLTIEDNLRVATDDEQPLPGHVYLAPWGTHLTWSGGRLRLTDATQRAYRPHINAIRELIPRRVLTELLPTLAGRATARGGSERNLNGSA